MTVRPDRLDSDAMTDRVLGVKEVAELMDMAVTTIHTYHSKRRMPPADVMVGQSPAWYPETIERWRKDRESLVRARAKLHGPEY